MSLLAGKNLGAPGIYRSVSRFTGRRGRRSGRRLVRLLAAALTLAATAWAAASPVASANSYLVHVCSDVVPVRTADVGLSSSISCNGTSDFLASLLAKPASDDSRPVAGSIGWKLAAPIGTSIVGVAYIRSVGGPWAGSDMRWELRSTGTLGGTGAVFDDFQTAPPFPQIPPPTFFNIPINPGVPAIWSLIGCVTSSCSYAFNNNSSVDLSGLLVTFDDSSPPSAVLQSVLAPVSGPLTLTASIGDLGSGLKSATLSIDGHDVATQSDTSATCTSTTITVLTPCALGPTASYTVDTTQLTEGTHTAVVTATDDARNTSSSNAVPFTVSNTPFNTAPPAFTTPAAIGTPLVATTGRWGTTANGFNFRWLRCPATVTAGAGACTPILGALDAHVYTPTGDDVGHRLMVQVTAVNTFAPQTRPVTVSSAPSNIVAAPPTGPGPGPGGSPPPGSDRTPPALSAVSLSRTRFRAPAKGTASLLRLTSSEAARLSVVIERALPGKQVRRAGKLVCSAVRTPVKRGRCTLYKTATTLTRPIVAGRASVALSGRAGTRRLAPGTYRIVLIARDAAGNASAAKRLTFTVLR